jgi:hypothetical protein
LHYTARERFCNPGYICERKAKRWHSSRMSCFGERSTVLHFHFRSAVFLSFLFRESVKPALLIC